MCSCDLSVPQEARVTDAENSVAVLRAESEQALEEERLRGQTAAAEAAEALAAAVEAAKEETRAAVQAEFEAKAESVSRADPPPDEAEENRDWDSRGLLGASGRPA